MKDNQKIFNIKLTEEELKTIIRALGFYSTEDESQMHPYTNEAFKLKIKLREKHNIYLY